MWQQFIDLDPGIAFNSEQVALNNIYENLIYMNPPGAGEMLRPGLATSWEANEDGTEYTFYLREGVTFQDGAPFNADAVKGTMEHYLAHEGAGCTFVWDAVEDIEVIDEYTIKLSNSYPSPLDLISTASYCGEIMSPDSWGQSKEWYDAGNGFGTGPYMYESYDRGTRMILTRFDDYWGGWEDNQFDKVVFEIVEDEGTQIQMMQAGEGDFMRSLPGDKIEQLEAAGLTVYTDESYEHMQFLLNTVKPPLDNKLVRQALAYSFPYDEMIERGEGLAVQSRGAVPAAMWGHCDDCFQYSYDPDKARDLLEEAGYGDGIELDLTHMSDFWTHAWPSELWVFPASEVGITLELKGMTYPAMWDYAHQDPMTAQNITIQHWWPTWVTPYDPLFSMYYSEDEPFFNFAYYKNPEYDALLDEGNMLTGTDRDAAAEKFVEAQKILVEEAVAIWVMDIFNTAALAKDIAGFVNNPAYPQVLFFYELTTTR
jgi:peptide/nickel transport system substrate-binding protein